LEKHFELRVKTKLPGYFLIFAPIWCYIFKLWVNK
jgi:hypothetical protein